MDDRFLDADSPEIDPENDALGYSHFANEVAKTITKINSDDGFVIAITGEWGSGKTTTLNYIEYYLAKKSEGNDNVPLILHFNPWLFSGHQDIIFQFFSQIYSEFRQKKIDYEKLQPIFEKLFEFGSLLATISTPAGFFFGSIFTLFKGITKKNEEEKIDKLLKLKTDLTASLKNQNKTILIVIDDVDRLTANEIQELFRALKAVASFPKIIYLLAYDNDVVVEAFENSTIGSVINKGKGCEYLEKIVQLSFPLPPPKKDALNTFMVKNLSVAVGQFDAIYYDLAHWTWVNEGGINHFVNTPRKVKRLTNSLKILYPQVNKEVNVVDFIALEVLKQNVPSVYQKIRDNPHILLDDRAFFFGSTLEKPEELQKKFYGEFLVNLPKEDKDAIIRIVINLFPNSRQYLDPELSYFHFDKNDIQRARICSTIQNFSRYFRFELSDDDFSDQEILGFLSVNWDSDSLLYYFLAQFDRKNLKGNSYFSSMLSKLALFIDHSTKKTTLHAILEALFKLEDRIFTNADNSPQMFGPQDILDRIHILTRKVCDCLPPDEVSQILIQSFQNGTSVPVLTEIIADIGAQNGKYGNQESGNPIVPIETLNVLENIWIEKIQQFSEDKAKFFSTPNLQSIIFVWRNIPGHESEVKSIIQVFMKDDNLIIQSITSSRKNNYVKPIQPTSLLPFVNPAEFKDRVNNILVTTLNLKDDEKLDLAVFIQKIGT